MLRTEIDAVLVEVLRDRRLLAHPFYRRWEAGTLERGELAAYAAQYRHFEAALPDVLERVVDAHRRPDGARASSRPTSTTSAASRPRTSSSSTVSPRPWARAVAAEATPATAALVEPVHARAADDVTGGGAGRVGRLRGPGSGDRRAPRPTGSAPATA